MSGSSPSTRPRTTSAVTTSLTNGDGGSPICPTNCGPSSAGEAQGIVNQAGAQGSRVHSGCDAQPVGHVPWPFPGRHRRRSSTTGSRGAGAGRPGVSGGGGQERRYGDRADLQCPQAWDVVLEPVAVAARRAVFDARTQRQHRQASRGVRGGRSVPGLPAAERSGGISRRVGVLVGQQHDLDHIVADLCSRLPADITSVAGVPRSGLLPAYFVAKHLHIPLVPIETCLGMIARPIGPRSLENCGRLVEGES